MASHLAHPLIISFFLMLLCSSHILVSAGLCNKDDKKALIAIRDHFGNPYQFASWTNTSACCDWYGVECNEAGRVYDLYVITDDLSGTIPPAVGDLPFLQILEFHKLPNLVGSIPREITKLKKLTMLWISSTNITGPVPDFLSTLPSLEYINLSFNNISSTIPASLGELKNLTFVDISRNKLTGTLPSTLFQNSPPEPPYLRLSHNSLTGEVPSSFGALQFNDIDLSRNQFTGDASVLFGRSKVASIDISRNKFEFNLTEVEFPENLIVDMSHNMIYGSIPTQIVNISKISNFNVSYNRLCGPIPSAGQLEQFDQYSFFHNKCLCGSPLSPCK